MQKFNIGDRVRKNLWSGIWTVKDYDAQTNRYLISQTIEYQTLEYPKGNVMTYSLSDGILKEVINLREMKLEFEENVAENEIKSLPNETTLRLQQHLDIRDEELLVLRKIAALVGSNTLPFEIELSNFSQEEIMAIHNLIGKQYWFQIEDSEFIIANESHLIAKKDLTIITKVYLNYI